MFHDEFSATTAGIDVGGNILPYPSLLTKPFKLPISSGQDTPNSSEEFEGSEELSVKVQYINKGQKRGASNPKIGRAHV